MVFETEYVIDIGDDDSDEEEQEILDQEEIKKEEKKLERSENQVKENQREKKILDAQNLVLFELISGNNQNPISNFPKAKEIIEKHSNIYEPVSLMINEFIKCEKNVQLQFISLKIFKRVLKLFPQYHEQIFKPILQTLSNLLTSSVSLLNANLFQNAEKTEESKETETGEKKGNFEEEKNNICDFVFFLLENDQISNQFKEELRQLPALKIIFESKYYKSIYYSTHNYSSCNFLYVQIFNFILDELEPTTLNDLNLRIGFPLTAQLEAGSKFVKIIEVISNFIILFKILGERNEFIDFLWICDAET